MSEDARKECRTQGKYSDRRQYSDNRRPEKRQDKRQKASSSVKELLERKFQKRKSDEGKEWNTSLNNQNESSVRYQENSDYSFSQLEEVKRPIEIKDSDKYILSVSEDGESLDREQLPHNNTSFKTDNTVHRSGRNWNSKYTNNKTALKTHNKINEPGEIFYGEPSSHIKTSLKNSGKSNGSEDFWDIESSKNSGKSNGSEDFWDIESSPFDCNFLQSYEEIKGSKKSANKPSHNKKSAPKKLKIDIQNENLHAYASNFSSNSVVNDIAYTAKNKNFGPKENHDVPTPSPDHNMLENDCKVKNEPASNRDSDWTPNVQAKEFVPSNCTAFCEDNTYSSFQLENLLNYKVDFMMGDILKDYSVSLRCKVLEEMGDFRHSDQEELKVLCEVTDGTLSEKNQRIITSRIVHLVERALKCQTSQNFRKSYRDHRKPNHGNENYYSGKRYHDGGRKRHHQY